MLSEADAFAQFGLAFSNPDPTSEPEPLTPSTPPGHPAEWPLGTRVAAGLGWSTSLPDLDFETYSEAGYYFDAVKQKWHGPPGSPKGKKGLFVIGAAVYAEHPSTEVLNLAYNLKDGRGIRRWKPGMPLPSDLIEYILAGGLVEAWNSAFEFWIWNCVCVRLYGFPPLPYTQLRCAMAKARASGWPGALGIAGSVLGLTVQKDKAGGGLLDKFSMPRTPTKTDPRLRHRPEEFPVEAEKLADYNVIDIVTEAEASARVPDLEGEELEFWLADQLINRRGVAVDVGPLADCVSIVEQCLTKFDAELRALTGGAVQRASELAKLKAWLASDCNVHMRDGKGGMDEDALNEKIKELTKAIAYYRQDPARLPLVLQLSKGLRALELRQLVGSASVKKVFSMTNQVSSRGRLHDLYNYHGARTGRPTGEGPQPTNLPKAGPAVYLCMCGKHHGTNCNLCPWCGTPVLKGNRKKAEWGAESVEDALEIIKSRSLEAVRYFFGDALLTVSGCLRGLFVAAEGHDLICSDFSSIEGVVTACLAGEDWRVEMFATHGKAYELSVSKITGTPFAEIMAHAGYDVGLPEWWDEGKRTFKGPHHPQRQTIGKVAELACFTAETEVLTHRGYVAIVDVLSTDLLWDGIEWVTHAGVVPKGLREVIDLDGTQVTPDHPISCGHSWKEAKKLASDLNTLSQALAFGSVNLPSLAKLRKVENDESLCDAPVAPARTRSGFPTSSKVLLLAVTLALKKRLGPTQRSITHTLTSYPTTSTEDDFLTVSLPRLADAHAREMQDSQTTGAAVSLFAKSGEQINAPFCSTSSRSKGGTTPSLSLTDETSTGPTRQATSDSFLKQTTPETNAACPSCSEESLNLKPVYDIAHAGPRNRFTIRTNSGHLVVHNSGFGGWINAWKRFGADAFMNDDEIKEAILAWREASPAIVEFWGGQERREGWRKTPELFGLEGMAISAILNPGTSYAVLRKDGSHTGVSYLMKGDALYCTLPSGRHLTYNRAKLSPSTRAFGGQYQITFEGYNTNPQQGAIGWVTMQTYAGKLCENVVQATARDIQRTAILKLEKSGYPVVLHIYDEDVCEVPKGRGSIEEMERYMGEMPDWAVYRGKPWPIRANGGWRGRRYRKA